MTSGPLLHQCSLLSRNTVFLNCGTCIWKANHSLQEDTAFKDGIRCLWDRNTENQLHCRKLNTPSAKYLCGGPWRKEGIKLLERSTPVSVSLTSDQPLLLHTCCCWLLFRSLYLGLQCNIVEQRYFSVSLRINSCGMSRTHKEEGLQQHVDTQRGCWAGKLCVGVLLTAWCNQNGGG